VLLLPVILTNCNCISSSFLPHRTSLGPVYFSSLASALVLYSSFFPLSHSLPRGLHNYNSSIFFFSCVCTVMSLFSVIVIVTLIPSCCPPFYSSLLPCTDWIGLSRFSIDWYHTFFLLSSHLHDVHLNSNLQRLQLN